MSDPAAPRWDWEHWVSSIQVLAHDEQGGLALPRHWEERKRSNQDDGGIQDGFNGENYRKDTALEFPAWKSLPQQGWVALNGSRGWERAGPRKRE